MLRDAALDELGRRVTTVDEATRRAALEAAGWDVEKAACSLVRAR